MVSVEKNAVGSGSPNPSLPSYRVGQRWSKGGITRTITNVWEDGRITYKSSGRPRTTVGPVTWYRWVETGYLYKPGSKAQLDFDPEAHRTRPIHPAEPTDDLD